MAEKRTGEKPSEKKAADTKKKKEKKGKRIRTGRKHESKKITTYYSVKDGKIERHRKDCPRCGAGTHLAAHKNREYCGRCGYTIFNKKG